MHLAVRLLVGAVDLAQQEAGKAEAHLVGPGRPGHPGRLGVEVEAEDAGARPAPVVHVPVLAAELEAVLALHPAQAVAHDEDLALVAAVRAVADGARPDAVDRVAEADLGEVVHPAVAEAQLLVPVRVAQGPDRLARVVVAGVGEVGHVDHARGGGPAVAEAQLAGAHVLPAPLGEGAAHLVGGAGVPDPALVDQRARALGPDERAVGLARVGEAVGHLEADLVLLEVGVVVEGEGRVVDDPVDLGQVPLPVDVHDLLRRAADAVPGDDVAGEDEAGARDRGSPPGRWGSRRRRCRAVRPRC